MSEERHTSLNHQGLGLGKPGLPCRGLESPLQPGDPGKSLALGSHARSGSAEASRNWPLLRTVPGQGCYSGRWGLPEGSNRGPLIRYGDRKSPRLEEDARVLRTSQLRKRSSPGLAECRFSVSNNLSSDPPRPDFLEGLCHPTSFSIGLEKGEPAFLRCRLAARRLVGGAWTLSDCISCPFRATWLERSVPGSPSPPLIGPPLSSLDHSFRVLSFLRDPSMSEEKASSPSGMMGGEEKPVSGTGRPGWGFPWCPTDLPGKDEKKDSVRIVWGLRNRKVAMEVLHKSESL